MSSRQSGYALLIVLWTIGFLALLGTRLIAASRSAAQLADNLKQEAVLQAAADGAVARAMFAIQAARDPAFRPDGVERAVRIGQTPVLLWISNEYDRINLNTASLALLRSLLIAVGVEPARAAALAAAILDWRVAGLAARRSGAEAPEYQAAGLGYAPPGAPFQSVDELRDVLGMTPALFARLEPHVTVLTDSDPDLSTRDPVVALALTDAAGVTDNISGGQPGLDTIMRITVTAVGTGTARYAEVVVASADFQSQPPRVAILARQRVTPSAGVMGVAGSF
ncbi:MAG: general secretion pathway protein GspK [Acetobacteraceae bacterium]|nr:general secretion pathway protein GspK [Alphaproteobacteria bacterium]MBV8576654.1 general secretion pathway protein GspK [Acetobacteraceae bacterium]